MKVLFAMIGLVVLLVAPNMVWLNRSTVRIENTGGQQIPNVVLYACAKATSLGVLAPGESRFEVLPKCGDDTLEIRAGESPTNCRTYVEGDLYHVRASFRSPAEADCSYATMIPVWPLLIHEVF